MPRKRMHSVQRFAVSTVHRQKGSAMNTSLVRTVVLALVLTLAGAHGGTLHWDGANPTDANSLLTGATLGGAGIWDTSTENWWDGASAADAAWNNAGSDTAVFWGTAGTVTLGDDISTGGLELRTTGYTVNASTQAKTLTFSAADNTITLGNVAAATLTGAVAGTGNLIVTGGAYGGQTAGTLTLNGTSTGGWSGTTTVTTGMTLALADSNQALIGTSGISLAGGGIRLTNTNASQAALNRVHDTAGITANGGAITFTNSSGTTVYTETLGAVALNSGLLSVVEANNQTGSGSQTLTLGGLTRNGSTNAVHFAAAGTGPQAAGNKNRIVVTGAGTTAAGEIIGPWATTGGTGVLSDYAVYAADHVVPAAIAASGEPTWTDAARAYTFDAQMGTGPTLTAARTITALRSVTANNNATTTNATDRVTLSGHTFVDGDAVVLYYYNPTGFNNGQVYYVINAAPDTFQLAATPGGTVVSLNNDRSGVGVSGAVNLGGNDLRTTGLLAGSGPLGIFDAGDGVVTLPGTEPGTLHVNSQTSSVGIGVPVTDNGTGVLTLVKSGSGLLHLGNSANTFSGGLVINEGTVSCPGDGALGTPGGDIIFNGNGTLNCAAAYPGMTLNSARDIVLNNGAIAQFTGLNVTIEGNVTGSGGIFRPVISNVSLTLNGQSNSFAGPLIYYGSGYLTVRSLSDTAGDGVIGLGGSNQAVGFNWTGGEQRFDGRQFVLLGTTGTITLNNNSTTGPLTIATDLGVPGAGSKTLTLSGTYTGSANVFAGRIPNPNGNTLSLTKAGNGTWILAAENRYTGTTTVSAGTLQLGDGTSGHDGAVAGPIVNNATLIFDNYGPVTQADAITGTGSLTKNGPGALTLAGPNGYTGTTTVNSGTLLVDTAGTLNTTSGITVAEGAALFYNNPDIALTATVSADAGATIGGTGAIDSALVIAGGVILSPGASPGSQSYADLTWGEGGIYRWEINQAETAEGGNPGWDLAVAPDAFTLEASAADPFVIEVVSLGLDNTPGDVHDFNPRQDYSWKILDAAADLAADYAAEKFMLDLTGFTAGASPHGEFSLVLGSAVPGGDSTQLWLTHARIPEPGTLLLGALAAAAVVTRRPARAGRQPRLDKSGAPDAAQDVHTH
ncbi:MAG: Autotransporter-associated beta strand repeat protein [Lentisphaerae bacterium ADurb.BinA184]|nr:MAG: Autotransporter-associated beta strand repeat protein [Lentisphaerae bacterium ADurb.BinA184]